MLLLLCWIATSAVQDSMFPATVELPAYLHRIDSATGTTQSICTRCFATIARARQAEVLALVEAQHDCPRPKVLAHAA